MCEHNWAVDCDYHYDNRGFPVSAHWCKKCNLEVNVIEIEICCGTVSGYKLLHSYLRDCALAERSLESQVSLL